MQVNKSALAETRHASELIPTGEGKRGHVFLILEPDVKALTNARHPPDTDGDGV